MARVKINAVERKKWTNRDFVDIPQRRRKK